MAFIDCKCFSESLGLSISFYAILPQQTTGQVGMAGKAAASGDGKHPTLWLLHGMSDDHSIWMRRTSIERYASEMGLAVVMPSVHRSMYTNMAQGGAYGTFIGEELPNLARSFFPLSDRREQNFVAGLSMGGYGAFKLALHHPERFAAAASLSGVVDLVGWGKQWKEPRLSEMTNVFGDLAELPGSEHDLLHVLRESKIEELPALYQSCGTEDELIESNRAFKKEADRLKVNLHYEEGPGRHSWDYWDAQIQKVLAWLPLKR